MPHIHTDPGQHDQTASAYIIRTDLPEPKILLHYHRKLHKWMQFGGHIELDETPWQTIVHELHEETGYDIEQLQILQPKERITHLDGDTVLHPVPVSHITVPFVTVPGHMHTDIAYVFVAHDEPQGVPDEGETTEIKLFTRSDLLKLTPDETFEDIVQIALFALDTCLLRWEAITATNFNHR